MAKTVDSSHFLLAQLKRLTPGGIANVTNEKLTNC